LVAQIASEVKHEIDGEVLYDLRNIASATEDPMIFDQTPPSAITLQDHYDTFYHKLVAAGNAIFERTQRGSLNFAVGGTMVADIIEASTRFTRAEGTGFGSDPVGPHLSGFINGVPFYKNPFYEPKNWLGGYKGTGLFDAGYIYCPYYPVMTTQLIMSDDFTGRRGFATSYAKKSVNSDLYVKGEVVPGEYHGS